MMKKALPPDYMTFEEALQDPSMSEFHEVIHFLEKNKNTILFPTKFMMSMKDSVIRKLRKLHAETPDMAFLNVVITTLTGRNENMTPDMILEITDFIIKEWQNLQQKASEKALVKMYADLPELSEVAEDEAIKRLLVKPKI
jgi:hypothetical protein